MTFHCRCLPDRPAACARESWCGAWSPHCCPESASSPRLMSKPPPPALQLQTGAHTRTDTQTAQTTALVHPPTATAAAAAAAPVSGTSTPSSVAPTPATPAPNTPSSASMSTASTPSAREPHGGNAGPGPAPPPPSQGTQGTTTPAASAASTPGPAPSASSGNGTGNGNGQTGLAYPALHLTPLNGTFVPKQISLDASEGPGGRVKIGRQTNVKTAPNATNGYFDSKVLSRAHAEVWSEDGKVRERARRCRDPLEDETHPAPARTHAGLYQGRQVVERNLYQRRTALARVGRVRRL